MVARFVTKKQREVLVALLEFTYQNFYQPSLAELCKLCGRSSVSSMHCRIQGLIANGIILDHGRNLKEMKRAWVIRPDILDHYRQFQEVPL